MQQRLQNVSCWDPAAIKGGRLTTMTISELASPPTPAGPARQLASGDCCVMRWRTIIGSRRHSFDGVMSSMCTCTELPVRLANIFRVQYPAEGVGQ